MRADRLMSIMILLQNRGKMTAKELAAELEVSERTILRDMDALGSSGIPVVADRGKGGGWKLLDNFRSKLSGLTIDDMKAMFLFPPGELLEDLGLNRQALDTRQKLLASLPVHYRNEAQAVWERVYIDTSTWRSSKETVNAFKIVQRAVWESKRLTIHYEQANGEKSERLIEPLGLVAKGNRWYLVASRNGELRNYRISRIRSAVLEEESFNRPANFDLAAYWRKSKDEFIQSLPTYEVQVEMDPAAYKRLRFSGKFVQAEQMAPADNGPAGSSLADSSPADRSNWIRTTLRFNDKQEALELILGFAGQVRVLSPETLSGEIVDLAMSVIEFYKQDRT
ncbi:helix-turn-helix transcriptional regulator [Paenibacillus senegalensis]|uniref:helix-turn-helix transcriptional regulator n=1 Tax=Paenibacillus senegalensis TaxID=1465766 RepID=UPI0002887C48|nr:YafY family protein [Paenibacillus senegalensis]